MVDGWNVDTSAGFKDALGTLSRAYPGTGWGDDTADWEGELFVGLASNLESGQVPGVLSVDSTNGFSNSALYGALTRVAVGHFPQAHGLPRSTKLGCSVTVSWQSLNFLRRDQRAGLCRSPL